MHGHDPPNHPSGPFDVLLPDLSTLRFLLIPDSC
jgi:hypothetical protein